MFLQIFAGGSGISNISHIVGERNVLKSGGIPDISVTADAVNVNAGGSLHVQNLPGMPYPHADDDANTGVALMGLTFICGKPSRGID